MAVRTGKTRSKASAILLEALEQRQYASASKLIPTTPGFIGPVQPSSQTTTTNSNTSVATTTTTTSSSSSQFMLYDASFGNLGNASYIYPGFQQAYWTSNAGMHNLSNPSEAYADQASIDVVANLAKNGGTVQLDGTVVQPGALTFMDFEQEADEPVSYYVQRLNWFHQADPGGKVGIWGLTPGFEGIDRDIAINPSPQFAAQIQAQIIKDTPLINAMDVIIIPAYMLSPSSVNRDLQWITTLADLYHQDFPGKPVLAWTWGAYDTTWNPANDVLPTDVTQEYVQTCMSCCDGMVVWGPQADNNLILQTADQMVQPILTDATLPPQLTPNQTGSVGSGLGETNDMNSDLFSNQQIDSSVDSLLSF